MPNTLVHIGVQGAATEALVDRPDPRWVLLGCLLPDVPWIFHRMVRFTGTAPNLYDLRLYAAVQSSLLFCLVLAGALALIARRPVRTFWILTLGSALHLLIDMVQTKWANGVILFAPFSWEVVNVGWFWPESWITVLLTVVGLIYLPMAWRSLRERAPLLLDLAPRRTMGTALLGALYLALPVAAIDAVQSSDAHFVATLRDRDGRAGRYVEFDRANLRSTVDGKVLVPFTRERIRLRRIDPGDTRVISVRGVFVNDSTLRIQEWHAHRSNLRDLASVGGILAILAFWIVPGLRNHGRVRRSRSP